MVLPAGQFFCVITLDQHVIHRRTRVVNVNNQLSRSLEPTTYHPQEDRKWIHSPSWGEIISKLRETQHWTTSEEIRNTNRACFVQDIPHTDKWIKTRCFILHNPKCNTEQQQLEKETKRENIKDTVWLVDKCEHKQTVHFITHVIVLLNKVEIAIN